MGAIFGPNLVEGETEFCTIEQPVTPKQQYFAGLEAARNLQDRLGIVSPVLIWVTAEDVHPEVINIRDPMEENDPADWWRD